MVRRWPVSDRPPDAPPRRRDETTEVRRVEAAVTESSQPRDRCTLTILAGPSHGRIAVVEQAELKLGRGDDADVRIDDSGLSRLHARIVRRGDSYYVEDLDSRNGTFVDGRRIKGARQLKSGDRIQIGKETTLHVSLHDAFEQNAVKRLYESAVRDPLTTAYNRRYLDDRLAEEIAFAGRHESPLSVMLVDIDHFKNINDSHGHQAGDAVLRVVAGALIRIVRTEDLVARYGGEEFAVVTRGTDGRNAMILAERVRKMVAAIRVPWEEQALQVTVSIGVASLTPERAKDGAKALLAASDDALYRAKEEGRDRAVLAPSE